MAQALAGIVIVGVLAVGAFFAFRGDDETVFVPTPTPTVAQDATVAATPRATGTAGATASSTPEASATPQPSPTLPPGRHAEPAPIDALEVLILESFPPQYMLHIEAGLPSGCAQQYTHSWSRDADVIRVSVLNSFPDGDPICTMIYGMYELNINLGSNFDSGRTYRVTVNDEQTTFTAQ